MLPTPKLPSPPESTSISHWLSENVRNALSVWGRVWRAAAGLGHVAGMRSPLNLGPDLCAVPVGPAGQAGRGPSEADLQGCQGRDFHQMKILPHPSLQWLPLPSGLRPDGRVGLGGGPISPSSPPSPPPRTANVPASLLPVDYWLLLFRSILNIPR